MTAIDLGGQVLPLEAPVVMGVVNVTPDSFSDGGRLPTLPRALEHARRLVREGAAVIDVGGESTRPGAEPVSESEELDRVIPVIEALAASVEVPISIDTSKPAVMRAAVRAGARMINDVNALRARGALQAAVECAVPVCLMHMRGQPRTMQREPVYSDVAAEVAGFLEERVSACMQAGIPRTRLLVDPGFGFGKTVQHNLELLWGVPRIAALGFPVVVGLSRKSMLGVITGRPVSERLHGSVALATLAASLGAHIIRAHDVAPTLDALRVWAAVNAMRPSAGREM